MLVRIWRYRVGEAQCAAFEAAYGGDGDWARLFARQEGYLGTELLAAEAGAEASDASVYATIDRWREQADWLRFLDLYGDDYRALDQSCEALTVDETEIGDFVTA